MYWESKLKSTETRHVSETALFGAEYLWDSNPGFKKIEIFMVATSRQFSAFSYSFSRTTKH